MILVDMSDVQSCDFCDPVEAIGMHTRSARLVLLIDLFGK